MIARRPRMSTLTLMLLTAGLSLAHAAAPAVAQAGPGSTSIRTLGLTVETLPRLDSSTSAQPLAMLVAGEAVGVKVHWRRFFDGTRRRLPGSATQKTAEVWKHPLLKRVRTSGTHGAYRQLIEGRCDLIFEAREPFVDELKLAREKGVTLEVRPVARDAFVFIVNTRNPVTGLTRHQIRQIYTGKLTRWGRLGGPDVTINAYQRNQTSGSQQLMLKLVMKGLEMTPAARRMTTATMMGPINNINTDVKGLGYTVYFYERFMAPPGGRHAPKAKARQTQQQVAPARVRRMLTIDGVMPSAATIATGKYPLCEPVYIVIRRDVPPHHPTRRLRDFMLTEPGQALVRRSGYVTLKGDLP